MTMILLLTSSTGPLSKTVDLPACPAPGHGMEVSPHERTTWMCVVTGAIWRFQPATIVTVMLKAIIDGQMQEMIPDEWAMQLVEDGWRP
jgi:hypothetical protein